MEKKRICLKYTQHDRDAAGRQYVYPVLSRRAGGISLGINLNPNNACNWACAYCQVEGLVRGSAPPIDVERLVLEFEALLEEIFSGQYVGADGSEGKGLVDVAFSGNGEPTSASEFLEVLEKVIGLLKNKMPRDVLPVRLITNGSLLHRPGIQAAIARLGQYAGGEVWFKVDRASDSMRWVNGVPLNLNGMRRRLLLCAERAPTWVQTCWFGRDGRLPGADEVAAYLGFIREIATDIRGVFLYSIARQVAGPMAAHLTAASVDELNTLAGLIKAETGLPVGVFP